MPSTLKQLGGVALAATTLTAIYTVPAATQTVISSISVCNRSATATTFRISHAVAGAADATSQYLYYDAPIAGNSTMVITAGMALGAGDIVRGYAGAATVTMLAWGEERT